MALSGRLEATAYPTMGTATNAIRYGISVAALTASAGTGNVTAFLGPNGAGKTTTLRMLLDLLTAWAGGLVLLPTQRCSARSRPRSRSEETSTTGPARTREVEWGALKSG